MPMSTSRNPLSGAAFESRVLARLAEEGVSVEPSVFSATFDLFRAANRLMQDFESNVHRPLGMSWAGLPGAVLHLGTEGSRAAGAGPPVRGFESHRVEHPQHPRA